VSYVARLKGSKVLKNSASAYFSQASTVICGIATIPVLVKFLSNEQIAIWVLASSFNAYISLFDLGIGDAIGRKIAGAVAQEDQKEINRWWSCTLTLLACMALLILTAGLIIAPWFGSFLGVTGSQSAIANHVFAWMVVITSVSILNRGISGILVAQERTHLSILSQALSSWVNLFSVIFLLWLGLGLYACVIAYAARMMVIWICYHVLLRTGPNPPRWDITGIDSSRIRSLFNFSISFSFTVLVDLALSAVPPLALACFGATAKVPSLSITARAPTLLANVANRTVWAFYPGMLRLQLDGRTNEIVAKHRRASLLGFAISLFVAGGIVTFNRSFVAIIASEDYYIGDLANAVLAMIVIISPASHLFRCFLSLGGSMASVIPLTILSMLMAVGLSWLAFGYFGVAGMLAPMFLPVIVLGIYGWHHGIRMCGIPRSSISLVGAFSALAGCVLLCMPALIDRLGHTSIYYTCILGREVPLPTIAGISVFLICCGISGLILMNLFKGLGEPCIRARGNF
jgi:O-antigen/teichoic acid export membrane protein